MTTSEWQAGYKLLRKYDLSFDLQLYYPQMPDAYRIAVKFPDTQIILNHTGMPVDRSPADIAGWKAGMAQLAQAANVACKISGLGLGDWNWTVESIRPFVLYAIEVFGVQRCMFASNFPVDKLFSKYDDIFNAFKTITDGFSHDERLAIPKDGSLQIIADDFEGPNGLAFSPDECLLYVSESGRQFATNPVQHIRVFDVFDGGRQLSPGRIFHKIAPGFANGFRLDHEGNVWSSAADGVHCIAPDGTKLGMIKVPFTVSNLTLGGRNRSRLFICASHTLFAIYTNQRGAEYP